MSGPVNLDIAFALAIPALGALTVVGLAAFTAARIVRHVWRHIRGRSS